MRPQNNQFKTLASLKRRILKITNIIEQNILKNNNHIDMNAGGEEQNKEFCAKCGVEFNKYEMVRRRNEKGEIGWLCIYCASKYQGY